jgi:predicted metal-dependent hydrolase
MTELTVRHLQVDLDRPWPRHWVGGDAFRSAFFNALSFSFPAGEQMFIDAVRNGVARLDEAGRARFADEVRGFIGQEATHRRVHACFNRQLEAQGYVNRWEPRIRRRIATRLEGVDARAWVAATAATEHFTAILADYLLSRPEVLDGAEPRLRDLWLWHASEESEHRSTAFDLYRALGGDEAWRRRIYWVVTVHFALDLARQVMHNLWRDGHWWRPATWAGAWRLLGARGGLLRVLWRPWRRYLAPDFHPSQGDGAAAARWLAAHAALAPPVGRR